MVIFNSYVKLPEGIPCLLVSNIFENPISVIHFRHRGSGEYAYSTNSSPGGRRSMSMSMSVPGLVNVNRKLWKITIFNGKINYKLQCSIAMLNYQRVDVDVFFWQKRWALCEESEANIDLALQWRSQWRPLFGSPKRWVHRDCFAERIWNLLL